MNRIKKLIIFTLCLLLSFSFAFARQVLEDEELLVFDTSETTQERVEQMIQELLGDGVTIVPGSVKYSGSVRSFTNGMFETGISSGLSLDTSMRGFQVERDLLENYDYELYNLIEQEKAKYKDTSTHIDYNSGHISSVEFTMIATGELLNFRYSFASSEFNQHPNFNDLFGLFVKEKKKDGTETEFINTAYFDKEGISCPVTINDLRGDCNTEIVLDKDGNEMSIPINESNEYYTSGALSFIPYLSSEPEQGGTTLDNYEGPGDGVSNVFTSSIPVEIGSEVTVKFIISDIGDAGFDSYVFIEGDSLSFEESKQFKIKFNYNGQGGRNFSFTATENQTAKEAAAALSLDWNKKINNLISHTHIFKGWYKDSLCTVPANFNEALTRNTTYYAKWDKYNHSWYFYKEGDRIRACCIDPSCGCEYYGKENSVGLKFETGQFYHIDYEVEPSNATHKLLQYSGGDASIATVDKNGTVYAFNEGDTTIILQSSDEGNVTRVLNVKVERTRTLNDVFQKDAITNITISDNTGGHWKISFKYNEDESLFEMINAQFKGSISPDINVGEMTEIDSIAVFPYSLEDLKTLCNLSGNNETINFEFNLSNYSFELFIPAKSYMELFDGGPVHDPLLEDFSIIDKYEVEKNYFNQMWKRW